MKVHFYGSRGSIPTPILLEDYQNKLKKILTLYKDSSEKNIDKFLKKIPFHLSHVYGGNTSCVVIEDDKGTEIVLDAGSGLRMYGNKHLKQSNKTFNIFLTHFHWDHICGIPFFKPIYNPTNTICFYSTNDKLLQNLSRQQVDAHFPVTFAKLPAKKKFVILDKHSSYKLNGFNIYNIPLNHPGGCTGYIIEKDGKKISYITDTEFTPDKLDEGDFYRAVFEDTDLLIMDSQYSVVEIFSKLDWGHSSSNMAVNLSLDWNVKKLALFHFDPEHKDIDLYNIWDEANKQKKIFNKKNLEIISAVEGTTVEI